MSLGVEPLGSVLRWYRTKELRDALGRHQASAVMIHLTADSVFVLALNGRAMTKTHFAELILWCADHGVRTILAERHGRLKWWQVSRFIDAARAAGADGG